MCEKLAGRESTLVAWRVFVRWQVVVVVMVMVVVMATVAMSSRMRYQQPP